MNESAAKFAHQNRRQPIDLDAFEQRLRGDQPRAGAPDPLAELAVLVDAAQNPAGRLSSHPGSNGVSNGYGRAAALGPADAPEMLRGYARQMRAPQTGPDGRPWPVNDYGQPASYGRLAGAGAEEFAQPDPSGRDSANDAGQGWPEAPAAYGDGQQGAHPYAPAASDAPTAADAYTGWNPGEWTADAFQPRSTIPPEADPHASDPARAPAHEAITGAPARTPQRPISGSMDRSMPRAIGMPAADEDPVDAFERSVAQLVAARAASQAPAPDFRNLDYDAPPQEAGAGIWVEDHAGVPAQEQPRWPHDADPALFDPGQPGHATTDHAAAAPAYGHPGYDSRPIADSFMEDDPRAERMRPPAAPSYADVPPPRSRKPVYLTGAALAVLVLGIGATLATRGSMSGSGDVPVIAAASDPLRVRAPESDGGAGGQARNITILQGDAARQQPSNVVTRGEQPIDLAAVPSEPRRDLRLQEEELSRKLNLGDRNMTAPIAGVAPQVEPARASNGYFPEPRRVRTIMVRADGSLINPAAGEQARRGAGPITTASTGRPGAAAAIPPSRPVATQPKVDARVEPNARPATQQSPRVAAVERQPTPPPAAPVATPASGGGFAVQLSAPPTESSARAAATRLGRQYAQALGGRTPTVERAVVNNRTVWRIRVTGLERSDAASMCSRVQGAGGQCFVARN